MNDSTPNDVTQDMKALSQDKAASAQHPQRIGRYRIDRVLGQGGFGIVYLAKDEQLDRPVAVKVPHATLISKPSDAELYLIEARTVANLDHPSIVSVHDVGSTEEWPCYVVSKYIDGTDLSLKLKHQRLKYRDAAELVATVADALQYAHKRGLVHRDVKPGNILIGKDGTPYVVDFGLALREENFGKGPEYAGTPAYMSPEQARGEGHRVDGRSDIFSLGAVLYELLAGRPPFRGDTKAELREQVTSCEPRPLLQYDERIPKELQRICFKALSKRASERYSSAHELAQDLRYFLADQTQIQSGSTPGVIASADLQTHATTPTLTSLAKPSGGFIGSDAQRIKIVPKGLRSFDAHDADFFLELLPGPRDRNGLPDSLRFWKNRIEEADSDKTFSVGLIYGPSGCGKSSLVKAGLLPRLSEDVICIYIEATPAETETRLLHGLRKRCPALEDNLRLKAELAALRQGQGIPPGKKLLIVLDQFEQWLHAKREEENSELVQALRQCDGVRVQCIVMVRDDFWLAATCFGMQLEVDFVPGSNMALADLFDLDHARKVLTAFGRAFGKLPDSLREVSNEQKSFLKESVVGLADEGKVICVRLALFAEMMKGKAWTPATLKKVGGTKGIGVTFLEETFSGPAAAPRHRLHQKAARAVLSALLPDSGTDIKGNMRSHAQLMEASGYGNRTKDFDDLFRILDSEIRLITPTDPEGQDADNDSATQTRVGEKYFQLTHDFLVHSLRDWLIRKQKETRAGRAELKLSDTALTWNTKRENRFLPSLAEWVSIRTLTDKKRWTEPQQYMIRRADRIHLSRLTTVVVLLGLITASSLWTRQRVEQNRQRLVAQNAAEKEVTRIEGLVGRLVSAEPGQIPTIVAELESNVELAAKTILPLLQHEASTPDDKRGQFHARLASVSQDPALVEPLLEELLSGKISYVAPIRALLRPFALQQRDKLESLFRDSTADMEQRFRAALALADYVPAPEKVFWTDQDVKLISRRLVSSNAEVQPVLRELLRPIKHILLDELEAVFEDQSATVVGAGTVRKTYRIPSESLTQIAGLERVPEAEPAKPRAMKIHPAIAKAMGL